MVVRLPSGSDNRAKQRGFSYLFLLIIVAVLGIAAANAVSLGVNASRRDAEFELLAIGAEFENALRSYRAAGVAGTRAGPRDLEDLLLDRRIAITRRHLRKIYADPLTGRQEWGVVRQPDGLIVGVYTMAPGIPIKRAGFDAHRASFENAERYAQWVFSAAP
jgi:type II secretory pathway pseudopilin PulG